MIPGTICQAKTTKKQPGCMLQGDRASYRQSMYLEAPKDCLEVGVHEMQGRWVGSWNCVAYKAKRMKPIKRTKHFELGTDSKKGKNECPRPHGSEELPLQVRRQVPIGCFFLGRLREWGKRELRTGLVRTSWLKGSRVQTGGGASSQTRSQLRAGLQRPCRPRLRLRKGKRKPPRSVG